MEFYKESLNGEITVMQTYKESPIDVPEEFKNRIFHSELKAGPVKMKASDTLPSHGLNVGNNISLYAVFSDKETKLDAFNNLSKDGKVMFPIESNFGMLEDKFGVQWMLVNES